MSNRENSHGRNTLHDRTKQDNHAGLQGTAACHQGTLNLTGLNSLPSITARTTDQDTLSTSRSNKCVRQWCAANVPGCPMGCCGCHVEHTIPRMRR